MRRSVHSALRPVLPSTLLLAACAQVGQLPTADPAPATAAAVSAQATPESGITNPIRVGATLNVLFRAPRPATALRNATLNGTVQVTRLLAGQPERFIGTFSGEASQFLSPPLNPLTPRPTVDAATRTALVPFVKGGQLTLVALITRYADGRILLRLGLNLPRPDGTRADFLSGFGSGGLAAPGVRRYDGVPSAPSALRWTNLEGWTAVVRPPVPPVTPGPRPPLDSGARP